MLYYRLARGWQMLHPAGRSHRDIHTRRSELADIFASHVWSRKFDRHVDAVKGRARETAAVQIISAVEFCTHIKTVFWPKLLNEPAHLSVPDDGESQCHKLAPCATGCVARSCVTMRA